MERVPVELVVEIFGYFSEKDLCAASLVSKQWYQWALTPGLWKTFLVRCCPFVAPLNSWGIADEKEFKVRVQRKMVSCLLIPDVVDTQYPTKRNVQALPIMKLGLLVPQLAKAQGYVLVLYDVTHLFIFSAVEPLLSVYPSSEGISLKGSRKCLQTNMILPVVFARGWGDSLFYLQSPPHNNG